MIDQLWFYSTFIFIFSVFAIFKLIFKLFKSLTSNPPKPLELTITESLVYGAFVSYIITFFIFKIT